MGSMPASFAIPSQQIRNGIFRPAFAMFLSAFVISTIRREDTTLSDHLHDVDGFRFSKDLAPMDSQHINQSHFGHHHFGQV